MSYLSYKEPSLPEIQYSNYQETERNFIVKSGDEMNKNNQNKEFAKPHLQQHHKHNQNNDLSDKKNCWLKYAICIAIIIFGLIIFGLIIFLIAKKYFSSTTTNNQPAISPASSIPTSVAIMGTNNLEGKVYPTKLIRPDTNQQYNYGGLATLITLKNIVDKQYRGNFLYLDAGDQLFGGIQSSELVSSNEIMSDFFKSVNLTASLVGDYDFSLGPDFLKKYLKGRSASSLLSNFYLNPSAPLDLLPNQKRSMMIDLPNGIKIGLIGVVNRLNPLKPKNLFNASLFQDYFDYPEIITNQSKELRSQGANAIILIAHTGNKCLVSAKFDTWTNQNASTSGESFSQCRKGQILQLIDKLPEGTIDAVVQGRSQTIAHHYYQGIPFMGTTNGGFYTNFLYLNFDKDKKLINSSIEGPVPICQKIFQNTKTCEYFKATVKQNLKYFLPGQMADISHAGKLIPWKFHGVDVTPNEQFNQIIKGKWDQKMAIYRSQFIVNTEIVLAPIFFRKQYQLGNLFTNLLHDFVPTADFVLLNTDIFRSQWYPGPISYEQFFNMFPYSNQIVTFTLTGDNLIQSMRLVANELFFPVWNLQPLFLSQIYPGVVTPLPSPSFGNGTEISPSKIYKGVTVRYQYMHGNIFYEINQNKMKDIQAMGQLKQKLKPYLKKLGTIKDGTLIDYNKKRSIMKTASIV